MYIVYKLKHIRYRVAGGFGPSLWLPISTHYLLSPNKIVPIAIKGISLWNGHFVEVICIEIGNALLPFIECFEKH